MCAETEETKVKGGLVGEIIAKDIVSAQQKAEDFCNTIETPSGAEWEEEKSRWEQCNENGSNNTAGQSG